MTAALETWSFLVAESHGRATSLVQSLRRKNCDGSVGNRKGMAFWSLVMVALGLK